MKKRKQRVIGMFALAIALVATTIAYAALSTTLRISGNVTKKGGSWDIHLDNVSSVTTTGTGKMTTAPKISGTNISFAAELSKPGDSVSFTFDIVNGGTIDAFLENVAGTMSINDVSTEMTSGTELELTSSNVKYEIYVKGSGFHYETWSNVFYGALQLKSLTNMSVKIVLIYDPNATSVDATDKKMNVTASFPFEQI